MTTYRCAVMGNPIAHSKSPEIHHRFAQEHDINLIYDKILVPTDSFKEAVNTFFIPSDGVTPIGLNITLPFKVQAFKMAEKLSEYARHAGAVNTFYKLDNQLVGDNTDGIGLCCALDKTHGHPLKNKSVLLLGAGGAARGAIYPLLQSGIKDLCIANRTLSKAQFLINEYQQLAQGIEMNAYPLDKIVHSPFDFIINATSMGLKNTHFSLSTDILHSKTVCYDMVYGKNTSFLKWAQSHGMSYTYDGYSMLIAQARCSFRRWFDV